VVVQPLREIVPRDVRHHEVDDALRLVDRVDVDDVRMVELGSRLGLAQEARLDLAAERELRRQDFDGDGALQAPIFRPIDDTHPATADLGIQLVMRAEDALNVRAQLGIRILAGRIRQSSGSRV
jgi:hypothetical protein